MADTNIDAIKKNYKYNFYLVTEVPDHVICLRVDLYMSHV